jgi:hypothetical protein
MKRILILFLLTISLAGHSQTLNLPNSVKVLNPKPLDAWYYDSDGLPYADAAAVLSNIGAVRHEGQRFRVGNTDYCFEGGIADVDLVPCAGGGGSIDTTAFIKTQGRSIVTKTIAIVPDTAGTKEFYVGDSVRFNSVYLSASNSGSLVSSLNLYESTLNTFSGTIVDNTVVGDRSGIEQYPSSVAMRATGGDNNSASVFVNSNAANLSAGSYTLSSIRAGGSAGNDALFSGGSLNTVEPALKIRRSYVSGSNPSIGHGVSVNFVTKLSDGETVRSSIQSVSTNVSGGNEAFDMVFRTMGAGSVNERFRIKAFGDLQFGGSGNSGTSGQVLTSAGSNAAPTWQTPSGGVSDGDKGDITVSGSGATWTIDNTAVTYSKIQNVAANSFLANATGSSASVQAIATNRIPLFGSAITGTPSSSTYLRGDGSWQTVSGGGDVSKVGTPVDNQIAVWTGDGTVEGTTNLTWDGATLNVGGGGIVDAGAGGFIGAGARLSTLNLYWGDDVILSSNANELRVQFGPTAGTNKKFKFAGSGITDNTEVTYTLPNASGTLALTSDIVANSTSFIDTVFTILNAVDTTAKMKFLIEDYASDSVITVRGPINSGRMLTNTSALDKNHVYDAEVEGETEYFTAIGTNGVNISGLLTPSVEAGTSFTLDEDDRAKGKYTSSGSAITVTVPSTLRLGYVTTIMQEGSGVVTLDEGANVSIIGKIATTGVGDFIWLWLYKKDGGTSYYVGR